MVKKIKKTIWAKLTHLPEEDLKKEGKEVEVIKKEVPKKIEKKESTWLPEYSEGKLSLDVYQKENKIVVRSALAGVKPEDLEIIIDKDILTIKGERKQEEEMDEKNYFHQECFWGRFSRTIILPTEVKTEEIRAHLKNGILTIDLPIKEEIEKTKRVKIKK